MKRFSLMFSIMLVSCGQPGSTNRSAPDHGSTRSLADDDNATSRQQPAFERVTGSTAEPLEAPLEVDFVGRWNDPHDGFLVVTDPPRGGLILEFHGKGRETSYPGSVTAEGLRFMRGGIAEAAILLPGKDGRKNGCLGISDTETYYRG